jgi:hypothetical protein
MGLRNSLARRRAENRITRQVRAANRPPVDNEAELNAIVQKYQDKAYSIGKRMFDQSQARKAEGKQLLKNFLTHRVGETYRTVMGPKSPQLTKRRQKK